MHFPKLLTLASPWLILAMVLVFAKGNAQVPSEKTGSGCSSYLPPGKGQELLNSLCTSCHDFAYTVGRRKNSGEWRRTVSQMLARLDPQSAEYLGEEIEILTRYLGEYFGPLSPTCETLQKDAQLREKYLAGKIKSLININSASLTDLMRLPGISKDNAEMIIKYRASHGPFKSKEDLKAVSGIGDTEFEKLKGLLTVD